MSCVFVPIRSHARFNFLCFSVNAYALKALFAHLFEQFPVVSLAGAHDRGKQHQPGAFGERRNLVDNLIVGLLAHGRAGDVRIRRSSPRKKQPEEVVDFRDRTYRRPGIAAHRFLVDSDHGRKAIDEIHVGPLHHAQELSGVGAQAFHVAATAFGVNRVEGQT